MILKIFTLIHVLINVFVLVGQSFLKIPALKEIAPRQSDPPFKIAQLAVLVVFIALGTAATLRFRVEPVWPDLEVIG